MDTNVYILLTSYSLKAQYIAWKPVSPSIVKSFVNYFFSVTEKIEVGKSHDSPKLLNPVSHRSTQESQATFYLPLLNWPRGFLHDRLKWSLFSFKVNNLSKTVWLEFSLKIKTPKFYAYTLASKLSV